MIAEIRSLKSKLKKLSPKEKAALEELNNARREYDKFSNMVKKAQNQLSVLENNSEKLIITEHAILRYIERVCGINIDRVEQEMRALLDSSYFVNTTLVINKSKFIIRNNTLVSVVPSEDHRKDVKK